MLMHVESLKGISEEHIKVIYSKMKGFNDQQRLLVCLYFLSEMDDSESTLSVIEENLISVFPPTLVKSYLPEDYESFQASVIRGQFNRETKKVNEGKMLSQERLWRNVGEGKWRNTTLGNEKALEILHSNNINVISSTNQTFSSWEVLSEKVALKTVDKSVFLHNGTGVPMGMRDFFDDTLVKGEHKNIVIIHREIRYLADYHLDNVKNPRSRIIWTSAFADVLKETMAHYHDMFIEGGEMPDIELPKLRFEKNGDDIYFVDMIVADMIISDADAEKTEDNAGNYDNEESGSEGKVKYHYGKKYERNPENRRRAIEYHGTSCRVCGFNFEEVYGIRGRGYIEIHHIKPLSSLENEIKINPKTDLVPVCANCHRMIHREKDNVLSIEELKSIILKKK